MGRSGMKFGLILACTYLAVGPSNHIDCHHYFSVVVVVVVVGSAVVVVAAALAAGGPFVASHVTTRESPVSSSTGGVESSRASRRHHDGGHLGLRDYHYDCYDYDYDDPDQRLVLFAESQLSSDFLLSQQKLETLQCQNGAPRS